MSTELTSGFVRDAVRELVERQLRDDAPPEVAQNVERLVALGYTYDEALSLVGCVLSREMFNALGSGRSFDAHGYVAALAVLPALPWS